MHTQEILKDIAPSNLALRVAEFEDAGASVSKEKQPDGNFTITAIFDDGVPENSAFNLPVPRNEDLGASRELWGTCYYGQPANEVTGGITLRNRQDQAVGPAITQRDWCLGAMEGTIVVTQSDGSVVTYNFAGTGSTRETSCAAIFPHVSESIVSATERARFQKARGKYGDGAQNFILSPYRTLAVDQTEIALGTALYIPDARGVSITLPDGSSARHDGYFFAADTGGLIKDNHVDFFLGVVTVNPFSNFVKSEATHTFTARQVTNAQTIAVLAAFHR